MAHEYNSSAGTRPETQDFLAGDYNRLEDMSRRAWAQEATLQPGTEYTIDTSVPLDRDQYLAANIAAVIVAGSDTEQLGQDEGWGADKPDTFVLVDLRNQPKMYGQGKPRRMFGGELWAEDVEFVLINRNYDPASGAEGGYKGVRRGETINIGRRNPPINSRFGLKGTTSGNHFRMTYDMDGKLTIADEGSTNGTKVFTGAPVMTPGEAKRKQRESWQKVWGPKVEEDLLDGNAHIFNLGSLAEQMRAAKDRARERERAAAEAEKRRFSYERFEEAGRIAGSKRTKLPAETPCVVDIDKPLMVDEESGVAVAAVIVGDVTMKPGEQYPSGVGAPDTFVLLDLRSVPVRVGQDGQSERAFGKKRYAADVEFLLVNKNWRYESKGLGFKGIRKGETVTVGRDNETIDRRFGLGGGTGGEHFSVTFNKDGKLIVEDKGSALGTSITTAENLRKLPVVEEQKVNPNIPMDDPALKRLMKEFSGELRDHLTDVAAIWAMISEIRGLQNGDKEKGVKGLPPKRVYRQLAQKYHPDIVAKNAAVGTPEYERAQVGLKLLNSLITDKMRNDNAW